MADEIAPNLIQECQNAVDKIAQIEQELRIQISRLEKQSADKKLNPPGSSKKRGKKSSRRRK